MSQSRRWCFTINNYSDDDQARLRIFHNDNPTSYLIFGREVAASGTPHLQGFVVFPTNRRLNNVKRTICPRGHFEIARGTSKQAADYCKKEGDFDEYGQVPGTEQGKRNDFAEFKEWVIEQPTKPTARLIAREFPNLFVRYARILEWVDLVYPTPELVTGEPRPWQRDLGETLDGDANDREVIFVVDTVGGCGKSWFVKWWLSKHGELTQLLSIGKRDDLAYAIDESKRWFLFDVPRSQSEFLQYSVLEQLKDRLVFSPKYCSRTKTLQATPHVVVFMNESPNMTKLSADRYKVINLRSI